jgi:beta-lactamase class A
MPVAALCEAALIVSDNTAANLLVAALGGPADVTAWLRSISDAVTRLDRVEPAVNACIPGDPRDTTSSNAMVETLARLVLGSVLTPASREMLTGWMIGNRTGAARIRAGLPSGWRVGDKTGTSENGVNGTSNDIAVIWPAGRAPLLVVTYLTQSPLGGDARNAVLADVGRIAAGA